MNSYDTMQQLNPRAIFGREEGKQIIIEDVKDPDGRWYRIEYKCNSDGSSTTARVLYNPWGSNPYSWGESHLSPSGEICLGNGAHQNPSPFTLDFAVRRARFWCMGYSFLREKGYERVKQAIPGW
jgi:hypothetical protein